MINSRSINSLKKRFKKILIYILILIVSINFAFPIILMTITSFKTRNLLYEPARVIFKPTIANYQVAITKYNLLKYLQDSAIVSSLNVILCLIIGVGAAYALARFSFRGKLLITFGILSSRIFPSIALVIPFYIIGLTFRFLDTYTILIIVFLVFNLPFMVLMMRSFFENVPQEIEEAAMLDGCTRMGALIRCVLPQVKTGIFATSIISFMFSWNEFTYALFLTSIRTKMISTAVIFFKTERGILWGEVSALGVVAIAPVLLLCILTQKFMVKGLTMGTGGGNSNI